MGVLKWPGGRCPTVDYSVVILVSKLSIVRLVQRRTEDKGCYSALSLHGVMLDHPNHTQTGPRGIYMYKYIYQYIDVHIYIYIWSSFACTVQCTVSIINNIHVSYFSSRLDPSDTDPSIGRFICYH